MPPQAHTREPISLRKSVTSILSPLPFRAFDQMKFTDAAAITDACFDLLNCLFSVRNWLAVVNKEHFRAKPDSKPAQSINRFNSEETQNKGIKQRYQCFLHCPP